MKIVLYQTPIFVLSDDVSDESDESENFQTVKEPDEFVEELGSPRHGEHLARCLGLKGMPSSPINSV